MCHFFSCHHIFLFLAGMSFSAALNHLYYHLYTMPATHWGIVLTPSNNLAFFGGALLLSVVFLFLARGSHGKHAHCACGKEGCTCSSKH